MRLFTAPIVSGVAVSRSFRVFGSECFPPINSALGVVVSHSFRVFRSECFQPINSVLHVVVSSP